MTTRSPSSGNGAMTSAERSDLLKIVRQRERVAKSGAARRAAELVADFEQQLATEYSWADDEVWRRGAPGREGGGR